MPMYHAYSYYNSMYMWLLVLFYCTHCCILVVVHMGALDFKIPLVPALEPLAQLLEVASYQHWLIFWTGILHDGESKKLVIVTVSMVRGGHCYSCYSCCTDTPRPAVLIPSLSVYYKKWAALLRILQFGQQVNDNFWL